MTDGIAMRFEISFKSGKPVYLQLVDQVRAAVASGALRGGEALPSIRPLAEDLRVNRNTVAKAYSELESQGVIETRAGKGCFVRENPGRSPLRREARHELLVREIDQAVVAAHHLQVSRPEFLKLAAGRFDDFETRREAAESAEPQRKS